MMATAAGPNSEAATTTQASCSLDLGSSPVPGQIGYCILDLDGQIVVDGGQRSNNRNDQSTYCTVVQDAPVLYQMLQETTSILPPKSNDGLSSAAAGSDNIRGFRRMTIDFGTDIRYIIGRDSTHIYLIQTSLTS